MLAFVYDIEGKLSLKEVPEPKARNNSAIIKIEAASICGTDIRLFNFGSSKIKNPPRIIGHEGVGTLVDVGSEIRNFREGDRVQVAPALGCGSCGCCKKGHTNLCDRLKTIGWEFDGTFAEYMEVPADAFAQNHVNKIPDNLSFPEATLAEPVACIINAQSYLNIGKGDTVAVFGSGFIGSMHAALAYEKGAGKVFMIDVVEERLKMARKFLPGLMVINSAKESLRDIIAQNTDTLGVDVAITACSVGSAQVDALNIIAKMGRISLFGGIPTESKGFIDSNIIHYKEASVYGASASAAVSNREALEMLSSGKLTVKDFANNPFPLKDINKAFDALKKEEVLKAILQPGVK
jgi:L-iditol 2-dehydrogenase